METSGQRMILDCTLRDGGYVNDWEFDTRTVYDIMDGLYDAGVRTIEIGIMGKGGKPGKSTSFPSFDQMEPILEKRKTDCRYAVMINQSSAAKFKIPQRSSKTPELLRLAFFKKEYKSALETAKELKDKGYKVYMQAMATFMYSDDELKRLLDEVNDLRPDGFYIVDSFSTMYNEDVRRMTELVLEKLSPDVQMGFHAHNNIQMAYSNVITFFQTPTDRSLIADGSIFGMGRGAGNVPIELLMEYLNKTDGTDYDILKVLTVFQQYIRPIFRRYYWGYSPEYYLTASKNINSVYSWYLMNHGIEDLRDFEAILDRLPVDIRYTLSLQAVDQVIEQYLKEKAL